MGLTLSLDCHPSVLHKRGLLWDLSRRRREERYLGREMLPLPQGWLQIRYWTELLPHARNLRGAVHRPRREDLGLVQARSVLPQLPRPLPRWRDRHTFDRYGSDEARD